MNFGDLVTVDFGTPIGSEAGFERPAIVVTADAFLRFRPSTVFAVPLTSTPRTFPSHVAVERCVTTRGNVGAVVASQILDILAMITGMP